MGGLLAALPLLSLGGPDEGTRHTVFLSFDRQELRRAKWDDASLGHSSCLGASSVPFPAFLGSETQRAVIIERARALLDPLGVVVTDVRPPDPLPYDMVVIGGSSLLLNLVGTDGFACHVDCGNEWNRNVAFVFSEVIGEDEVEKIAHVAVHEVAHTWGLDHIENSSAVMFHLANPGTVAWSDECVPLQENPFCPTRHTGWCPEGEQNSLGELQDRFTHGPIAADVPPFLTILAPADGEELEPGTVELEPGTVELELEFADDHGGSVWWIEIPGLDWEHSGDTTTPLSVMSPFLPEGDLTIEAYALDHGGNLVMDVVHLSVAVRTQRPERTDGCTCSATPRPDGAVPGWFCLLIPIVVRRRRRADRRHPRACHTAASPGPPCPSSPSSCWH